MSVRLEDVLGYLGWRGQALDATLQKDIESAVAECESIASPKTIWREFPLSGNSLDGSNLALTGNSANGFLAGASSAVLMAATLGAMVDSALLRYSRFNVSHALLLDAAAAALIESVCDGLEAQIAEDARSRGRIALPRFSPGYGDLPLEIQPKLLSALGCGRRLGLTCTPENLLIPRKSVTAVIALLPKKE